MTQTRSQSEDTNAVMSAKFRIPNDFLWGASTSAHQIEGANTNSNWWQLENHPQSPFKERSGRAVDGYNRYPEDMSLLAQAGLNAYRFSLEWARIEPLPGEFCQAELAHYRHMITTAQSLGLTPVVTLHHFTTPAWFHSAGSWRAADAVDRFERYVMAVAPILKDVPWICTINEPNIIALLPDLGQVNAEQSSGQPLDDRPIAAHALHAPDEGIAATLISAHKRAVAVLRCHTQARTGWTVSNQGFEPMPGAEEVFELIKWKWEDRFLEVSRDDDFVGVQSYTTRSVGPAGPQVYTPEESQTLTGWPFRPDAVGIAIRNTWKVTQGTPILVTENGIATADDEERIAYTTGALRALEAAVKDGADVRGYLHWSALDNYEWGEWGPTFGLIAVDRSTFERKPRPSLYWLGAIASSHGNQLATSTPEA